jgi:hypothetical protein
MLARIGWYLLFIVVFALFCFLTLKVGKKQETWSNSRFRRFIGNQIQILLGLIPIVVIPWVLAGFFSRWFFLLVLAAFEVSSLLTNVSHHLFRIKPAESAMQARLWLAELFTPPDAPDTEETKRDPLRIIAYMRSRPFVLLFGVLVFLLIVLCLIAYFTVASYIYFSNPVHSDLALRKILTLNLALYVIGALTAAILNMALLSSPQITDNARRALFLAQGVYALRIGIILTVYLGLVGIGGERFLPQSLTVPARFTQYIPLVLLSAFYLLFLIVPYFLGLESRRRAQVSLYQLILKRIKMIVDVVGLPGRHDPEQLAKLRDEFTLETEAWIESEPMVKDLAFKVEHPEGEELTANAKKLVPAYQALKDQDLRYVRFSWTEGFKAKIEEMIEEYTRFAGQPNQTEMYVLLGGSYERFFRDEHREYEDKLKQADARKIVAPVLARLVGVLSIVPVVFQFGQKLVAILPLKR